MTSNTKGPDPKKTEARDEMLETLFGELLQAEHSAELHGRREAKRLADSAPGAALSAIAAHAAGVNADLPQLATREKLPISRASRWTGAALSYARAAVIDRLVEHERSYRTTLLGLRHGIDVVRMLQHVADASGRVELGGFCARWLEQREPLVGKVEQAMTWFAHHPSSALKKTRTQVATEAGR